jgi:hypothetical protein
MPPENAEAQRLADAAAQNVPWGRWGPYLSERQWGTVREDYSADGDAWGSFPHDMARSRAYRWGEDGLLGVCDDGAVLCFALALWNGADPILKERPFGLTNPEGNHGEDVKEYYYFLANTPTHSYMKALYKYPQRAFPYEDLVEVNRSRSRQDPEYELLDTGAFADNRYFDVTVEYAKAGPEDLLVRISATNRGPDAAALSLLPTLWFRNTWSWGWDDRKPELRAVDSGDGSAQLIRADHHALGTYWLRCEGHTTLLFTENESNTERLWDTPNRMPYVKDGINQAVVHGDTGAVNPQNVGTKVAARYDCVVLPGETETIVLRLTAGPTAPAMTDAERIFTQREQEYDDFYRQLASDALTPDEQLVLQQALAGLLWSKQFYHYNVRTWLQGDPGQPPPPPQRLSGRNHEWQTLDNKNILSMPDTWEYPWYAAWDLAFHCVTLALVDPAGAKGQLIDLLREWYMRPDGQIPAYEWSFSDLNPPIQAWAALHVYRTERDLHRSADRNFLERIFHKLLINFTWWVNREDRDGRNVFQGGFLGLDNIGIFNRDMALPTGGYLEQSDGTAWMGMYSLNMLGIALELAHGDHVYEDIATKLFEHFLYIAAAMNDLGGQDVALWNEEDGFFYDVIHLPDGSFEPLKVRTLVGLIPLLAVQTVQPEELTDLPDFCDRLQAFLDHRPDLASLLPQWDEAGKGSLRLLSLVHGHRTKQVLARMLDPQEFLSDHGIRSLSAYYREHPYTLNVGGTSYEVKYQPAESDSGEFGGNSNWRGPVWFPLNYLLVEALRAYQEYYSDDFLVEYPTGSGTTLPLRSIADDLSQRLTGIFLRGPDGRRPVFGDHQTLQTDPHWRDLLPFHEYFHGDTAAGLGAGHQTGWTALVANLLAQKRAR